MNKPVVGITMGDAAGIGPEIVVKSICEEEILLCCRPVVLGDIEVLSQTVKDLGMEIEFRNIEDISQALFLQGSIDVFDYDNIGLSRLHVGVVDEMCGRAAYEYIIRATDMVIAAPAPGFPGEDLGTAVDDLAGCCDMLYLHVDADILDESYVPNHGTREPDGADMEQVLAAIDTVMSTGKVVAFAVVSIYGEGEGSETSIASGIELIRGGLQSWCKYGLPRS